MNSTHIPALQRYVIIARGPIKAVYDAMARHGIKDVLHDVVERDGIVYAVIKGDPAQLEAWSREQPRWVHDPDSPETYIRKGVPVKLAQVKSLPGKLSFYNEVAS